jgi:CspA family cold shock protein
VIDGLILQFRTVWAMARGIVKFFNAQKGYGFVVRERKIGIAERDVFVSLSEVKRSGLTTLSEGQVVEYDLHQNHRGRPIAQNVKIIAAEPL